jgi:hypothetical protein
MRRLILLFLLVNIAFIYTIGQVWVEDDAVWHYDFYVSGSGFYKIELGTDTLIQNKNCRKYHINKYTFLQQQGGIYEQGPIIEYPSEFTHVSGDTVFYYKNDTFYTLFNFGAKVGDQWIINDEPVPFSSCDTLSMVRVLETGEVEINGINRRAIFLQTIEGSPMGFDGWVVENIGPIGGSQYLFPTMRNCDSTIVCFEQKSFKCFQDSRIGLYNPSEIDCEYLLTHVGIKETKNPRCSVYPNPTSGVLNIFFNETGKYQMAIIDSKGKAIRSEILTERHETISVDGLQNGIYILRFDSGDGRSILKKIIKK